MKQERLNCPNCGAPINNYICAYCGTQFYDFTNMVDGQTSYFRIKHPIAGTMLSKARPRLETISGGTEQQLELSLRLFVEELKEVEKNG